MRALDPPSPAPLAPPPVAAPRVAVQAAFQVAFQGDHGAYSEAAIRARWGDAAVPVPARANHDVARLVAGGAVGRGVLPVENTLAGSVSATHDALAAVVGVTVVGEVVLPIHHCVLALPGATLAGLRTIESHPVALAQCERWLAAHPAVEPRAAYDTAGAARAVAASGDRTRAALAGRGAAARLGLVVLAADVEDRADNQTRFLVLAAADDAGARPAVPPGTPMCTALLATADDVPGALLALLAPLAAHGLNLSRLDSRPAGEPWTYRFFVEIEHLAGDPALGRALDALRPAARALRVLGTFPRAGQRMARPQAAAASPETSTDAP